MRYCVRDSDTGFRMRDSNVMVVDRAGLRCCLIAEPAD